VKTKEKIFFDENNQPVEVLIPWDAYIRIKPELKKIMDGTGAATVKKFDLSIFKRWDELTSKIPALDMAGAVNEDRSERG